MRVLVSHIVEISPAFLVSSHHYPENIQAIWKIHTFYSQRCRLKPVCVHSTSSIYNINYVCTRCVPYSCSFCNCSFIDNQIYWVRLSGGEFIKKATNITWWCWRGKCLCKWLILDVISHSPNLLGWKTFITFENAINCSHNASAAHKFTGTRVSLNQSACI